ncbi:hypothetical protein [Guptibacillus hwajinpoensis]|uniref:hypothetical protein n=1 Tax=Guptibacillus hwajinpoensis TaxID=208199 RepID=UPI0027401432|nr:hypothetical protein [Pseudalkalibacillus hwajinpoensis]WLR59318.1 hypothetical protein LC071_19610 [Pseudalkalibacillus hwajinpoensis]
MIDLIVKFFFGMDFLIVAVSVAGALSKISAFIEKHLLSKLSSFNRYGLLLIVTLLFESGLVATLSVMSGWNFIDSWFVGSILLIAIIWLPAYFRPFQENASRTVGKFHSGFGSGAVAIHKGGSRHPFFVGTLLFTTVGIFVSFGYYFPYFI